jgi:hypothetical protein
MISLSKSDVPPYLRTGQFFHTLLADEDECFDVPVTAFKRDLHLRNEADLNHLLSSLRYWLVDEPPTALIEYYLTRRWEDQPTTRRSVAVKQFARELPYLICLEHLAAAQNEDAQIHEVLRSGSITILGYMLSRHKSTGSVKWTYEHLSSALNGDNVECLQILLSHGWPGSPPQGYEGRWRALSVACLQYLLKHWPDYKPDFTDYCTEGTTEMVDCLLSHGHTWSPDTLELCAAGDKLVMMRHLHERGCKAWGRVTYEAANRGNLEMLSFAREHGAPWDYSTLIAAAKCQSWECFKYALKNGAPCTVFITMTVAEHSIPMFRYLFDHGYERDVQACMKTAVNSGLHECIPFLRSIGAAWPENALFTLLRSGDFAALQHALSDGLAAPNANAYSVAMYLTEGSLQRVQLLHRHGCPWDASAVRAAVERGQVQCLEYLLRNGCPVVPPGDRPAYWEHPLLEAARRGHEAMVKLFLAYGHHAEVTHAQLQAIRCEQCRSLLQDGPAVGAQFEQLQHSALSRVSDHYQEKNGEGNN